MEVSPAYPDGKKIKKYQNPYFLGFPILGPILALFSFVGPVGPSLGWGPRGVSTKFMKLIVHACCSSLASLASTVIPELLSLTSQSHKTPTPKALKASKGHFRALKGIGAHRTLPAGRRLAVGRSQRTVGGRRPAVGRSVGVKSG